MITPFSSDGKVDMKAVRELTDWYIAKGADGIFAVCQSSEMFFLSESEKLEIAHSVADQAAGRIKVIASGHTADDLSQQIDQLGRMSETGVDAVVLVSNRLAGPTQDESIFQSNADKIFDSLPDVTFGLYECPYPYLRLLSDEFLSYCARTGKLVFLKDVSCNQQIQKRRVAAVNDTELSLFNANTSTVLSSWKDGYDGYNGVMANFHLDIYKWLYDNWRNHPDLALEVSDFLTLAGVIEARAYPVSAKYYQNEHGVPMQLVTRSRDVKLFNENARHEIESLWRMEQSVRRLIKNS
jgi:4-hydroxy-tetrahydrodipicolinate synthase